MRFCKRIIIVVLLFLLLAVNTSIIVKGDAGEERTVYLSATEYDYPPFSVTDSGEADGFSVDLLKAVAREMGITVTFKIDQWSVLKEELKNGELDILPLVGYTEERDEVYDFSVPYIVMRGNIFVRKGYDGIQTEDDLFGKEILVLDGDNSQEWAWSIGLDTELTATTTYLEAFQLLASGQYDAVLAQGLVGEKLISDHGLTNISPVYIYADGGLTRQKLNLEGYEQKFCFAVVEGDTTLLSILNEGLSIVSVNGTYDELYHKWFPFLLETEGVSTAEVLKYVGYVLIPIIALLILVYFIMTRRTIRIRTSEIKIEKERSEKYLHELILSGKIFETSIENAPVPIMIHTSDGTVLNISKAWTAFSGYQKEDIPSIYDWTEKAYGTKKNDVIDFISTIYSSKDTSQNEIFEITTKDGRKLIWDFHSIYIGNLPDDRAVGMSVAIDITERVQMDKQLKESEQRFKIAQDMSPDGFTILHPVRNEKGDIIDFTWIYENQAVAQMNQTEPDKIFGKSVLELFPEHKESPIFEAYKQVANTGETIIFEEINVGPILTNPIWMRLVIVSLNENIAILAQNITEQKRSEKALIESEVRFKTLFEKAPLGYQSLDENGRFLVVNQTWLDILGYEREEVLGKWFGDFLVESYKDGFIKRFELFKKQGKIHSEFEMIHKQGHHLFIEFEGLIGYDENSKFQQTYCTLNDITERKYLEQKQQELSKKAQESEENYRLLTTQMSLGLSFNEIICDDEGKPVDFRFISVNDAWESVMGIKKEVVIGNRVMDLFPNTESYWIENYGHVALTGEPIRYENYSSELGKHLNCIVYSPKPGYFAVIVEDITKRVNQEKEREYLLSHDHLTGLYTRSYFDQQLHLLDKKENLPLAIISFDINGLVIINEAFGHQYGDEFIKVVATILNHTFDENCVIARVSGDQFAVIMKNTTNEAPYNKAQEVAKKVYSYKTNNIQLSIAYGIAIKTEDEDISKLLFKSEDAMHSNKIFESQSYRNNSIKSIIKAYHEKNPREEEHSYRVSNLCEKFAQALNMNYDDINKLKAISHLHDIGKIAIDEAILNKPGKLTDMEWNIIKKHPEIGARIISASDEYAVIADDILAHHERFDGTGYPLGIAGNNIPIRARLISIIDTYDAMTSDRPYRKAMSHQEAIDEIIRCSNTQFDPKLVKVFVEKVIREN